MIILGLSCKIISLIQLVYNWRGVWNKALSDFWCNVKFSSSFTTEYKEIWKENLVIYQKSLKAFLQAPLQLANPSWFVLGFTEVHMQLNYFPVVGHTLHELLMNFINELYNQWNIRWVFNPLHWLLYVLWNCALGLQFSRTIEEVFLGHLKPL